MNPSTLIWIYEAVCKVAQEIGCCDFSKAKYQGGEYKWRSMIFVGRI